MISNTEKLWVPMLCLALAAPVVAAYAPICHFGFVNIDDSLYVVSNPHVQNGLNWAEVKWAFQATHASNWHPLTWLSHMLDCQLWGVEAGGHHITSLVFHLANTVLVFLVWRSMTGALWPSAFVAALFGLHPLHVESVAWVSERKDVLSTFLGLLCLWCYIGFTKAGRHRQMAYILSVIMFALCLMAKSTLVTRRELASACGQKHRSHHARSNNQSGQIALVRYVVCARR